MRSAAILIIPLVALTAHGVTTNVARAAEKPRATSALEWPAVTQSAKPWARWWWLGSAVDKENLTRCLETYHAAGLGGVEITCIYGVQGQENRHIPYLSDRWVEVVSHAIQEANRLGMGVDLPPGSGWRIGGPSVERGDGNADVRIASERLDAGTAFEKEFDALRLSWLGVQVESEGLIL